MSAEREARNRLAVFAALLFLLHFLGNVPLPFVVGQVIEGVFVAPKLVGDRAGLEPLWMVFALLAGAAALGVLVRVAIERCPASPLYRGAATSADGDARSPPEGSSR